MYIVIYAGGCYGQFVTFTLDWLQGNYSEDFRPFTPQGNAHDNNSPIRYDLRHALEDPVTNSHMHPIQEKDSMDDMQDVIDISAKHNLQVVTETFPLKEANIVLQKLKNSEIEARAVLIP